VSNVSARRNSVSEHYDTVYSARDFFGQDNVLYRALVRGIISRAGVRPGSRVLDAGCGQGYLARFLAARDVDVWCFDLSMVGLRSLERYGSLFSGRRILGDVMAPPFNGSFDFVFQRSCSLLNDRKVSQRIDVLNRLIDCAKIGGVVCVVYNSTLSDDGEAWLNHSLHAFRDAFPARRIEQFELYAVNKMDCLLLGKYSFNRILTALNRMASRVSGKCCEIVAIGRRRE
jgi:SAM-dependent methyltransferase